MHAGHGSGHHSGSRRGARELRGVCARSGRRDAQAHRDRHDSHPRGRERRGVEARVRADAMPDGAQARCTGPIAVLALVMRAGHWSNFVPFVAQRAGSDPLPGALAPALVGAFFAFGGWWEISKLAGEARDPARTVPRALAIGVSIITAIYILTSAVFRYLVPLDRVTSGETFAAQAGEALFGAAGGKVFALIVIVAVLGSLLGFLVALTGGYSSIDSDCVCIKVSAAVD